MRVCGVTHATGVPERAAGCTQGVTAAQRDAAQHSPLLLVATGTSALINVQSHYGLLSVSCTNFGIAPSFGNSSAIT